jgi:hypothetical protein
MEENIHKDIKLTKMLSIFRLRRKNYFKLKQKYQTREITHSASSVNANEYSFELFRILGELKKKVNID